MGRNSVRRITRGRRGSRGGVAIRRSLLVGGRTSVVIVVRIV